MGGLIAYERSLPDNPGWETGEMTVFVDGAHFNY